MTAGLFRLCGSAPPPTGPAAATEVRSVWAATAASSTIRSGSSQALLPAYGLTLVSPRTKVA